MSNSSVLKVRLSFKGRPLRSYSFTEDVITIGRDPDADVCLDNTGVSRQHAKLERTPHGYYLEDLGSANGTFLNDEPVSRNRLCDQDVIRIGKFSLWIALEMDRRGTDDSESKRVNPAAFQGTTVLTNDQLARVMASNKQAEEAPQLRVVEPDAAEMEHPTAAPAGTRFDRTMMIVIGVSVVVGATVAGLVVSLLSK